MSAFSIPHLAEETPDNDRGVPRGGVDVSGIPAELKAWAQWVVWRRGDQRPNGRYAKVPYMPQTDAPAKSNDPMTWGTFDQALAACKRQRYDGIGFMLSAADPFLVIDLDHCRDRETGVLTAEATTLLARLDSYGEVSPSKTGVHVYLQATSPAGRNVTKPYEVYTHNHFITITGERLPTAPTSIEARQEVFNAWYCAMFGAANDGHGTASSSHRDPANQMPPLTTDEAILRRVQRSGKAAKLWAGDRSDYASASEADAALIACLARWTRDPDQLERLLRRSHLSRPKWDREDYVQRTIQEVLETIAAPKRSTQCREQRITYTYGWQRRDEAPGERDQYLRGLAEAATARMRAQIDALKAGDDVAPLVITLAPGVGKTRVVSTLGATYNVGWVSIRRDLYQEVCKSAVYRFIERCQPDNCPDAARMSRLAALRRTVMPLHRQHENGKGCGYYRQFEEKGSAFYRVEHLPSGYLLDHDAVIVDELEALKWLKEVTLTVDDLVQARRSPQWEFPQGDPVRLLLKALQEVLENAKGTLHSKALFDALDAQLSGLLVFRLEQATAVPAALDERPKVHEEADIPYAEAEGAVIVPYLMQWLREDLPKWQQGREWNSRVHIAVHCGRPALHLLTPLRPATGNKLALLDATANADVLSRLLGLPVQLERQEVIPPPHTRHLAVRIQRADGGIKRYGKKTLVDGKYAERSRDRVIREARHLLAQENPDGSRSVGLITYKDCKEALGEALDIPAHRRGHFGGVRGSNDWEDCDILVVIGTPTPPLGTVLWAAQALYTDDPTPIDTTGDGRRYRDPRLVALLDYLVNSELTQVAHRNRPIRHDGRVVITFTSGVVDYLPVTEEIVAFGDLPTQRRQERKADACQEQAQRMDEAYDTFAARTEKPTVKVFAKSARVSTKVAGDYLRTRRRKEEMHFPEVQ